MPISSTPRLRALLLALLTLLTLTFAEPPTPFQKSYANTIPGAHPAPKLGPTKTKPPPTRVDIRAIMGGGPIGGGSARLWKRGVENAEVEMEVKRDAGIDWKAAESDGSTYYSDVEA